MTTMTLVKVERDFGDGTHESVPFTPHKVTTLEQLMAAYGSRCEFIITIRHPADPLTVFEYTIAE